MFQMCRALGAHLINNPNPDLTVGPIPAGPSGLKMKKLIWTGLGFSPDPHVRECNEQVISPKQVRYHVFI